LDFKNAFKIAEKYHAEALCAEAVSYDFTKSENWRCLFENIRTELAGLGGRNSPHTPLPPASP